MSSSNRLEVGVVGELSPGQRRRMFINGRSIVLFNIEGRVRAIDDTCPHQGASVANGRLDGCMLSCPAHGLRFDLRTGRVPGESGLSLTTIPVYVIDQKLILHLPDPDGVPAQGSACSAAP